MTIRILKIIAIIGLVGTSYYQFNKIKSLNSELEQKVHNITQLESDNYSLIFKKGELEKYINDKNTQFKQDIDSVCKQYNIKIKDLNKIINTKNVTIVTDTVYLPGETIEIKNDSLYTLKFSNENTCISASVKAITTDPNTKINFERLESKHESFSMVHREKKKWWQIFKKRKLIMTTVDNCGETKTRELEIK